jgi:hypothetical protein
MAYGQSRTRFALLIVRAKRIIGNLKAKKDPIFYQALP